MDHDKDVAQPPERTAALTIGDLAERTGLSPAVLRMWETRHGFPEPRRLASGHRRYTDDDVELVRQVLRRKEAGIRLEVAIAEASATKPPAAPSIYAELRRRHPNLVTHRLRKSTLIALSWAIEDECCAVADTPVLFGAFQRGDFYEPSAPRWNELSRVARSAIVFADHWEGNADDAFGPVRATLPADAAMRREWAVVCDALDSTACLSAWELPGQADVPDRQRVFECLWTTEPLAVRDAAAVCAEVAAVADPRMAQQPSFLGQGAPGAFAGTGPDLGTITNLVGRIIAYADKFIPQTTEPVGRD